MVYIDFDGVILDTEGPLFEQWIKRTDHHFLPESEKIKYIQEMDWDYVLNNSLTINDSLYYLSQMDPEQSAILTKVHSIENEAESKLRWIRNNGIVQPVFFVPYFVKKSDIVSANGNTLIDDSLKNLREWVMSGGIPVFFDKDNDNIDTWQQPNTDDFPRVLKLSGFSSKK